MTRTKTIAAAVVMIATALGVTGITPAKARTPTSAQGARMYLAQQNDVGASAAAAAASAASGGRVLDVKRRDSKTGIIYRVKVLLPGGRVRSISVDGQTGQVRGQGVGAR